MGKRKLLAIIFMAASAGMAVLAYILLPETVVIQFSAGSSGNSTAPKLLAILIPTALGIGGAATLLLSENGEKAAGKGLLVSGIGIALGIFMIVVNCIMQ